MLTSIKFKTYVFVCFIKTSAIYAVILIMMSTNNIVKWPNAILQKKHTFIMKCSAMCGSFRRNHTLQADMENIS